MWGFLWLLFAVLVLGAYVAWNPPLVAAARALLPVPKGILFVLGCLGIGAPAAFRLTTSRGLRLLTALSLGLGATGMLTFFLGAVGWYRSVVYAVWLGFGLILFVRYGRSLLPRDLRATTRLDAACLGMLFLQQITMLPYVAAPEAGLDALSYHLLIPKLWLKAGAMVHLPFFVEANYPPLAECISPPVLLSADARTCRVVHYLAFLGVLAAIGHLAGRAGLRNRFVPPLLFATMPVVSFHAAPAWNDFFFVLFTLTSLAWLLEYRRRERLPAAILAGLVFGLAAFTQYTFVLYLIPFLVLFFKAGRPYRLVFRGMAGFAVSFFAISLPWLLKNFLLVRNPVYPFLATIFPSEEWPAACSRYFLRFATRFELPDAGLGTILTFPVKAILTPRIIESHTGFLPLILVPFLFRRGGSPVTRCLKRFLAAGFGVWLLIHTETRSLVALLAVFFVVAAAGVAGTPWWTGKTKRIVLAVAALGLAVSWLMSLLAVYYMFDPLPYFFGREPESRYLARMAPNHRAFAYLNGRRDVDGVMLLGGIAPYYLEAPCLFSGFADIPAAVRLAEGCASMNEVGDRMRSLGISHLVLDRSSFESADRRELYTWSPKERAVFLEFVASRCRPLASFGNDTVLAVSRPAGP